MNDIMNIKLNRTSVNPMIQNMVLDGLDNQNHQNLLKGIQNERYH